MDAGIAERALQVVGQCTCVCPLAAQQGAFWNSPASGALVVFAVFAACLIISVVARVVRPD